MHRRRRIVRSKTFRTLAIIGMLTAIPTLGLAAPAAAHEERTVAGYDWAVGFGDEPTLAGFPNSVQLLLSKAGKPVTKLPGSLKVAVEFGDASKDLELEPNFEVGEFGTPGDYRAFFIPTRPGKYTFHFAGRLGRSSVDESFTSGPATFSEAESPTSQEFPVQDPTAGELAQRIDREVPRLSGEIQSAASTAEDKASTATTIAIIGLIVGVLGIAGAGIALSRSRRT
jgi:hypothetical protein